MSVEFVTGTFEPHVGDTFTVTPSLGGEPQTLTLTSVEESSFALPDHPAFSLLFHAPGTDHMPQQIVAVEHEQLGRFDLFLVPLGPEGDRMQYEAVIN
jgi:hypothetical protein